MSHVRTQIREAIISNLTGLSTTGTNIFDTQIYPLERIKLPALTVFIEKENALAEWSTLLSSGVLLQTYELPVVINGYAKANHEVQNILDTIAVEVVTALKADRTLGGLCKDLTVDETPEINISGEGEQPIGRITLNCAVLYRIADNVPDISLL